jgi:hypothetical protein
MILLKDSLRVKASLKNQILKKEWNLLPDEIEFPIETDIIIDHLSHVENKILSTLKLAMMQGVYYTSVMTSAELYFNVKNDEEKNAVDLVLFALKVLGIHPLYSLNISEFFNKVATTHDAVVCSLAKFNKLPIITNCVSRFKRVGIKIISPIDLRG